MEEKKNRNRIILLVFCVSIVTLTIPLTYAFFLSQTGTNEQEKIRIKSGDLALAFRDNDETIENMGRTWSLGETIEKELNIENTGTKDAYARISWDNLINTYLAESLTYTLEEKSDDSGGIWKSVETVSANVPRSETASTLLLADHLLIPAGHTYIYKLKITFENLEAIDQTADLNARFITKFTLEQGTKQLTIEEILANLNIKISETNLENFANPAKTDETADGLFSMQDDKGISYYYRGAVEKNYVKFGRDASGQDMWWRIIRFNGDGTMRMQYDGVGTSGTNTYTRGFALTSQPWNVKYNDAKYVGWMYGGSEGSVSTSREEAQRNETDSPIKTKVDEWYKKNIVDTGYSNYVADSIFCNDRSIPGKNITLWPNDTELGYGPNATGYGALGRFVTGDNDISTIANENPQPQFTCPQENDKFTVEEKSGGNGALTYPVGLITADEIVTAGSGKFSTASSYYLKKEDWYWSFSPFNLRSSGSANMFNVLGNGYLKYFYVGVLGGVAPVINLKTEYLDKLKGNGTIDNPYYLQV